VVDAIASIFMGFKAQKHMVVGQLPQMCFIIDALPQDFPHNPVSEP
jgi:hypothetical protein